jgi:hypothetical protein
VEINMRKVLFTTALAMLLAGTSVGASFAQEPVVEPAAGPEPVLARVVLLVEPVVLLVVPVLLELPVLLAVQVQVPMAVHRLAPQPANRDRADKAASPTPHVDG